MNSSVRILSLTEIEAFDPHASSGRDERRAWCPLCGEGKPKDASHRCLCFNIQSGLWNCKRCGEKGRLREFWSAYAAPSSQERRNRAQNALKRVFEVGTNADPPESKTASQKVIQTSRSENADWRAIHQASQPIQGTAGEEYLVGRSITIETATRAGVLFSRAWHGRATLLFPFCNPGGEVVAISGRALQNGGMDKPAAGPKKQGAFFAPVNKFAPLDEAVPAIVICEAPLDALSIAVAGFPALAIGGTAPPEWLPRAGAFRRVVLALDADDAGDEAAEKIGSHLRGFGARCERLQPENAKDWNEFLIRFGQDALSEFMAVRLL